MATTITKLFPTGILQTGVELDEVSYTTNKVSPTGVYSGQFNEVDISIGSINFNKSSSQYISTTVTAPGSDSVTYEWWFKAKSGTQMLQTRNNLDGTGIDVGLYAAGGQVSITTANNWLFINGPSVPYNVWNHIAVVRNGSTAWTVYLNGTSIGGFNFSNSTSSSLQIGTKTASGSDYYDGQISNFRYVKGTAVYTSDFTVPNLPLSSISGTELLLSTVYGTSFLSDSSANNRSITNINTVTSVTDSPFPAERKTSNGSYMVGGHFDEYTMLQV